jgi:hypothetical protein
MVTKLTKVKNNYLTEEELKKELQMLVEKMNDENEALKKLLSFIEDQHISENNSDSTVELKHKDTKSA